MRRILIICLLLFASIAGAATLQWNASVVDETHGAPTGYRIHRGTAPGVYTSEYDAGNALQWHIPDDWYGNYYFAASAYIADRRSGYSNEVFWQRAPPAYAGATNLRASKLQQQPEQHMTEKLSLSGATITEAPDGYWLTNDGTKAFDGNTGTKYWAVYPDDPADNWLKVQLASGAAVVQFRIWYDDSTGITVSMYGSNDDSSYTLIGSDSFSSENGAFVYSVEFSNSTSYTYYRFNFSDSEPGGNWLQVMELELYVSGGGTSAVPANRGNIGMMLGMSNSMWLDNDFLKPVGGN